MKNKTNNLSETQNQSDKSNVHQSVKFSRLLVWFLVVLAVLVVFYWLYVSLGLKVEDDYSSTSPYPPSQQKIIDFSNLEAPTNLSQEERENIAMILEERKNERNTKNPANEMLDMEIVNPQTQGSVEAISENYESASPVDYFNQIRGN